MKVIRRVLSGGQVVEELVSSQNIFDFIFYFGDNKKFTISKKDNNLEIRVDGRLKLIMEAANVVMVDHD